MTTALPNANVLIPTCAVNVPPYRRLTAAKAITATVLQNARRLMPTTAGIKRRLSDLVRRTRPVLTSPTALPKSVPGPANPGINKKEALASWRIPVRHIINVTARISIVPERPVRRILQNAAFIVLTTCIRIAVLIVVCVVEGINISIAVLPVLRVLVGEMSLNLLTI